MSTISYAQAAAQAAKGQPMALPAAPQSVSSQATSTTSSQSRDVTAATTSAPSVAASTTSNDIDANENPQSSSAQSEALSKINTTQSGKEEETSNETSNKASSTESSETTVPEVKKPATDAWTQAAERRGKGANASSTRSSEVSEAKKSRKPKKARGEKDSEQDQSQEKEKGSEAPKVELSEAPIPSVNIWQQRAQLAQAAKVTQPAGPTRSSTSNTTPSSGANPSSGSSDNKSKPTTNQETDTNAPSQGRAFSTGAKAQRKVTEIARDSNDQGPRRAAPRGRGNTTEKAAPDTLPAVTDVSSWPTPETAVTELKTQDKVEKQQEKQQEKDEPKEEAATRERKWTKMDYVPSVAFNTPMPSRSRGGRVAAPRGGRESGPRGHHAGSASVDRSQAAASVRSSAGPQDRNQDGANGRAASVVSHTSKRTSVDNMISRDVRKSMPAESAKISAGQSPSLNGKEESFKQGQAESVVADQQQGAGSGTSSSLPKDNGSHTTKDSHQTSNNRPDGSSRPRGGHKGRGGHGGPNNQSFHGPFNTNGQGFPPPSHMTARHNQYANNFPMYGSPYSGSNPGHGQRGSRHNSTQSFPYNGHGRGQANGSRPSPIQTANPHWDPSVHPASAFPGAMPPFYPGGEHLLQMVMTQIDYYFSTDNLCKDLFLRRHMDSQGFVFLSLVASFSRMKKLTTDFGLIRAACEESDIVDLVMCEDQQERIRAKIGWETWILDNSQRDGLAKDNDGPASFWICNRQHAMHPYQPPMMHPYAVGSPAVFSPNPMEPPFTPFFNGESYGYAMNHNLHDVNGVNGINGVNGHASQLSAEVPEFSPLGLGSFNLGNPTKSVKGSGTDNAATNNNGEAIPLSNGIHEKDIPTADKPEQPYTNGIGIAHDGGSH